MITDKVKKTIRAYGLLRKNDRVVVGVSGGPDSLALLHILSGLRKELRLELHVAHLDHQLRPGSARDLEFVAAQAKKLRVGFTGGSARIAHPSEESCRKARLEFLFAVAKKQKAGKICLGHNLDDQAETVLMRLIRGAGLLGLAGIVPLRKFGQGTIVRPLIEVTRREIESYLRKKRLRPRIDETNAGDLYLRNRLRNELLPLLERKYNRNIKELLSNTAQNAGYDYDYLSAAARRFTARHGARVPLAAFARLHPSLRRIVVRLTIGTLQGDTRRLTFRHVREVEDLALNRPERSIVNLPRGIAVVKTRKTLFFRASA